MDFFSELKQAREAKKISLNEISDATLINLKMLEALERGDTSAVPQAYIRAFIREYASVVGLDKDETMTKYDAWLNQSAKSATPAQPIAPTKPVETQTPQIKSTRLERFAPIFLKIMLAIAVLVMVDIVLWSVLQKEPTPPVQESSFRDVVKDRERAADTNQQKLPTTLPAIQQTVTRTDTATKPNTPTVPPIVYDKDSLTLVATTSDSVWLEIVTDDDILSEHYLMPNQTISWRAKNEFWISAIGNPSAIKLRLNNKPIVVPIKQGFVTRDLRITRDSLATR